MGQLCARLCRCCRIRRRPEPQPPVAQGARAGPVYARLSNHQLDDGSRPVEIRPAETAGYGATNTTNTQQPGLSISAASSRSMKPVHHYGRPAYKFDPPAFIYDHEPEYLISPFKDASFDAAQRVVDLFKLTVEVSEKVKEAIEDCMRHIHLPQDSVLPACLKKIRSKRGYNVDAKVIDANPPKLDLPKSCVVPPDVASACRRLNEALCWSWEFTNDTKHTSLKDDMFMVKSFKGETALLRKTVAQMNNYKEFISDVRKQADCFIADFLDSCK